MTEVLTAPLFTARLVKYRQPPQTVIDDAHAEAEAVRAAARAEAADTIAAAKAEAERILAAAGREAQSLADRRFAAHLAEARVAFAGELTALRPALARLMRDGLRKLVGLACPEAPMLHQIDAVVAEIGEIAAVELTVSPADAEAVRRHLGGAAPRGAGPAVTLGVDPALAPGCARATTAGMTVEIDLEAQLDLFERLLAGAEIHRPHGSEGSA